MTKYIFLLFLVICQLNIFSQEEKTNYLQPENRRGQLFFKVGGEYRITPLPNSAAPANNILVNSDKQNSGSGVFYTLDMFLTKNLSLGFSHTLRYDEVGGLRSGIEGNFGSEPMPKALIQGYHFYIDYHFKVFRESEIYLRLGRSLINRGTEVVFKETFSNGGEPLLSVTGAKDYAYEPWNFGIGWKKRKVELMLAVYTSNISEYFATDETFIIPYFKFSYNLGRL